MDCELPFWQAHINSTAMIKIIPFCIFITSIPAIPFFVSKSHLPVADVLQPKYQDFTTSPGMPRSHTLQETLL
jgi:hypothetical protein